MIKSVNLKSISVERESFTSFQKCYLPDDDFPGEFAFPGNLAICKYKNSDKSTICRIFPMNNIEKREYCEIDQSVTLYLNSEPNLLDFMSKNTNQQVQYLSEIQEVSSDFNEFTNIDVEIFVVEFNNKLMADENSFCNLLKIILKCYTFTNNCFITVNQFNKFNYGISNILIKTTDLPVNSFGTINSDTKIHINKKYFGTKNKIYTELGGLDEHYERLSKIFDYNLLRLKENNCDSKMGNQILIAGSSGVGKTSLIYNLAKEKLCNIFEIRSTDILRPHPGETEATLRQIFNNAMDFASCQNENLALILIEDVESLCPELSTNNNDKLYVSRVSLQLLNLLDQVNEKSKGIIVIGTTSNIENVNLKIRRPGRLEIEIYISLPNKLERTSILRVILKNQFNIENTNENPNYPFNIEEISNIIAVKTSGFVGTDLSLLVQNVLRQIVKSKNQTAEISTKDMILYFDNALKIVRPSCLRENISILDTNNDQLNNIGGLDDLKKLLDIYVLTPLKNPECFQRFSMQPPRGILLYGPPGCAKTTIAKYLAVLTNMTFISISSAEIYSPYVGDAEKFLIKIFNKARMSAPAIIFFDEIDSLVGNRSTSGSKTSDVQSRIISTLLTEMDGIGLKVESTSAHSSSSKSILIVAATNRPDMIDNALMRPGRFDKLIHVRAPNQQSRYEILKLKTNTMPIDDDVDLIKLSERTNNFSGADLCNLCNEAALHALTMDMKTVIVNDKHFEYALNTIRPSLTEKQINIYNDFELLHRHS